MAQQDDRIYRTRDGLIAGVCGGIARHLGVDAGFIRLLAVVLAAATLGAGVVAYLACWLIMPLEDDTSATVDVAPDSIASDMYGQVINGKTAPTVNASASPVSAAHVPPPVPPSVDGRARATASAPYFRTTSPAEGPAAPPVSCKTPKSVFVGVTFGIVLVVMGMAMLLSNWVHVFSAAQFWPLIVVAFGIARMVIPGKVGHRMTAFFCGLLLFMGGMALLVSTLGMVVIYVEDWIVQSWPLLAITAGFLVLGNALKSPTLVFCAIAVVLGFFFIGMLFYADPGPAQELWVPLPMDAGFDVDLGGRPW